MYTTLMTKDTKGFSKRNSGIYLLLLIIVINLPGRQPNSYGIFIVGMTIFVAFYI